MDIRPRLNVLQPMAPALLVQALVFAAAMAALQHADVTDLTDSEGVTPRHHSTQNQRHFPRCAMICVNVEQSC